jgi:hypothetical protein
MLIRRIDNGVCRFSGKVALNNLDDLAGGSNAFHENFVHAAILPR